MNHTGNDQETPLLTTKFYMPVARPGLISRARLMQRLEAGLQQRHRLLLIAAPAGYGKTTLAAAWLSDRPDRKSAWLSLDEAENEPARFIACVRAAFAQVGLDMGQRAQGMVERGSSFAPATVGAALLEDLAHTMVAETPHLLVLDDYHRIQNSVLHELVQFLVEHLPLSLHLVLLTREDPPLPLARWRVQHRVTELRAKDLRFTVDETAAFFRHTMPLDLSADLLSLLAKRTEGWAAGLQLAALSMQDHTDPAAFVQYFAGDDRQVVDYLGDEVLARQPAPLLRFLLYTSILERMCGELCEALLPDLQETAPLAGAEVDNSLPMSNGQRILEALERRNLFVTALDNRRHWYRYHHLFADLLRHRLQITVDAAAIAELHRRAAHWCADHGLASEAVTYALSAGDSNLAAELVERALAASATWSGGNVGMWRAWWRALPAQTFAQRPLLCLRISRALYLAGHMEEAEHLLDEAELALKKAPERYANVVSLQAQAAVHRAAVAAMRGEIHRAIDATEAALLQLPQDEKLARARAFDTLGMSYELHGDLERAVHAYQEASTLAEAAGVQYLVINARCEAAMVQIAQGQLHRALQICHTVIELATVEDAMAPLGLAHAIRGEVWREQNLLEAAEASLLAGIERSHTGGITDDLRHEYLFLARLRCAQGEYARAHIALQQVDALLQHYGIPRLSSIVEAHRVRIWLAEGWLAPAARWAESYAAHTATEYRRDFEDLTLTRVWLASARTDAAVTLLERVCAEAERGRCTGYVIEGYALLALARAQGGNVEAALAALEHTLALAAPEGYVRVFLDEGRPMLDLLHRVAGAGRIGLYARQLLAHSQYKAQLDAAAPLVTAPRESTDDDVTQALLEPLTARELEVLMLLARRFTNDEIAHELVVSLPTVKSHAAHIYAKLGASDRREAVSRALRLGILSA